MRMFVFAVMVFALFRLSDAVRGPVFSDPTRQTKRVATEFERQFLFGQGRLMRVSEVGDSCGIRIPWDIASDQDWTTVSSTVRTRLQQRFHVLRLAASRLVLVDDPPGEEWSVVISQPADMIAGLTLNSRFTRIDDDGTFEEPHDPGRGQ